MPPPLDPAFPEMVELVTETMVPELNMPMPPPKLDATLPNRVELVTVVVPPVAEMPAEKLDLFEATVELVTVTIPEKLRIPPPAKPAVLPEIMELLTVRVPALRKAPPSPATFDPVTVTPDMLRLAPGATEKTLKLPELALMVSEEAAGPVIVNEPAPEVAAMAWKPEARVIVVLTPPRKTDESKTISSFALVAFASRIACLREPEPEFALVVTV